MNYLSLTKENFFDKMFEKEYPNALKIFCEGIDAYKKSVNWDEMFSKSASYDASYRADNGLWIEKSVKVQAPKFHEIPFSMQTGIIEDFFRGHNIILMIDPAKNGFSWTIVDLAEGVGIQPFLNGNNIDLTVYADYNVCKIDCIKACFKHLESKLNPTEDESEEVSGSN